MMKWISRKWKSLSKRALSVFMSILMFIGVFAGTLTGVFFAIADNPTATGALNTYVPVQYINLKPVAIGEFTYIDDEGVTQPAEPSRTSYGSSDFEQYLSVDTKDDQTVRFTCIQDKPAVSNDTTYVYTHTQVNQKINLMENPLFMLAWDGSARVNGNLNFTVTKNNKTYYLTYETVNNVKKPVMKEVSSSVKEIKPSNTEYANSKFDFYMIAEGVYAYPLNATPSEKDFPLMTQKDVTVDFYAYLYKFFNNNQLMDYWPEWGKDGNYLTVNYVNHVMVSEKMNTILKKDSFIDWNTCGLGRSVMNQYNTLAPRLSNMPVATINGSSDWVYGKTAKLDDGTFVFRNTSTTQNVKFAWDVQRYINVNELQALVLDADYSESDTDFTMDLKINGRNITTQSSTAYSTVGWSVSLNSLINGYSDKAGVDMPEKYQNVRIHLENAINNQIITGGDGYANFAPDDQLYRVRAIELTLPPNAKLSIRTFGISVENEYAASTTADTVYPWSTSIQPDSLPPEGTPAASTLLAGASSIAYNWAATDTPLVQNKIDLLSMTDQHVLYDSNGMFTGFEKDDVTGYWRTVDGVSYFTSNTKDLVYRSFKRRDKSVTGVSSTDDSTNYLLEVPVSNAKYLYYSYSFTGDTDAAVGLYFKVYNPKKTVDSNNTPHWYEHYHLGQSGLSLQQCDGIMDSTTEVAAEAHRSLCSTAPARTGVIDVSSIGFTSGDILQIEEIRFYVTGVNTKVKFDYLFFGSESLSSAATDTIAKNSGDAFPWSITHDEFKEATIGTDSDFTFANRIDLISDFHDRIKWGLNLAHENATIQSVWNGLSATEKNDYNNSFDTFKSKYYVDYVVSDGEVAHYLDADDYVLDENGAYVPSSATPTYKMNSDGSITLTAKPSERYVQAWSSFDHNLGFTINKSDLASLRYLNYSVEADPGMRWTVLVKENSNSGSDSVGVALRTWSDAMLSGDFIAADKKTDNDGNVTKGHSLPNMVGKSYFREMELNMFHNSWFNGEHNVEAAQDKAWSVFTVPGSETGCFDLSQIQSNMSWDTVISLTFIAYKDPSIKSEDGKKDVSGSVTFNYLYLTSEPLTGDSFGTAALDAGDSYSWPYDADPLQGDARNVNFYGNTIRTFHVPVDQGWGATNFYYNEDHEAIEFNSNFTDYYTLYYSFSFTKKDANGNDTGADAYPAYTIAFMGDNSGANYRFRNRVNGVLYGTSTLIGDTSQNDFGKKLRGVYRMQMPESGAIAVKDLGLSKLEHIRVYYEESKYKIHVQYAILALSMENSYDGALHPSQSKKLTALGSDKVANFKSMPYKAPDSIEPILMNQSYTDSVNLAQNLIIDLNRTPYLFYSVQYDDVTGTFEFDTTAPISNNDTVTEDHFYRDGSNTAQGSDSLLLVGNTPPVTKYLPESETGCIDVRAFYQKHNALPANGVITIESLNLYQTKGGKATYYYMYFGSEADKTIDLIPSVTQGDLKSGVSTHSWAYDSSGDNGELKAAAGTGRDEYITDSLSSKTSPPSTISEILGDTNNDGFNDLYYENTEWSFYSICYGQIRDNNGISYKYVSTGNNQMSGLSINLNETPYLHFSISQEDNSLTSFLLQTNDYTSREIVRTKTANEVRPWLSCYNSQSPAGQLMNISPQTSYITFYKDTTMTYNNGTYNQGELAGVIDLRSWYTETNGFDDIISLERVRFYTTNYNNTTTKAKVNHFYLSSSCGSAYSVTFDKNDGSNARSTIQVLKNANKQYVSDKTPTELNFKKREGYTFVGWYTDPEWENYFDIENTPITGNIRLYAGWIKNSDVVHDELNMLTGANTPSSVVATGKGEWEVDDEALHIRNTATDGSVYSLQLPINKAYSLYDSRSIYLGFDVNKSSQDASIILDLKSLGSNQFDLIGSDFADRFKTSSGILTAAPYNDQLPMYMVLASNNLLPVKENVNGYVYAKTITFNVPAGVAMHIRYATAAKSMEVVQQTVVAPSIDGTIIDILDPKGDNAYIEQLRNLTYSTLKETTEIYDGNGASLKRVHIEGAKYGYATLGSLYGLGKPLGSFSMVKDSNGNLPDNYLYFHVTQPDDSTTTFNFWASIYYTYYDSKTGSTVEASYHPPKWSSFYDGRDKGMGSQDDMIAGSIPREAYSTGTFSGRVNLSEWYADSLDDAIEKGYIPSDSVVSRVVITGVRLYSVASGTNATFDYLAIGGDIKEDSLNLQAKAVVQDPSGATVSETISDVSAGQIVRISVDKIANCAAASNPSKEFLGWSFTDNTSNHLIWWNTKATNDKQYSASNPGGSWATSAINENFVTKRADVSYQLTGDTDTIYPVFADTHPVSLTVELEGLGTIDVHHDNASIMNSITSSATYVEAYGNTVILSTNSSGFAGWYDDHGVLVSSDREYICSLYSDCTVTAKFTSGSANAKLDPIFNGNDTTFDSGHSIVWLQAGDEGAGKAGESFKLLPVNNGAITSVMETYSNINDTTHADEIVCYWSLNNGQMVDAVAPEGYHWEQQLSDGTRICVTQESTYRFITQMDMKLICVANTDHVQQTRVIANDYAVSYTRTESLHNATIHGQVLVADGESVVSCGFVMANRPTRVELPSYDSTESYRYEASAWNSTTGQFTVSVDYVPGMARYIRAFAITRNEIGEYKLVYSDMRTISF